MNTLQVDEAHCALLGRKQDSVYKKKSVLLNSRGGDNDNNTSLPDDQTMMRNTNSRCLVANKHSSLGWIIVVVILTTIIFQPCYGTRLIGKKYSARNGGGAHNSHAAVVDYSPRKAQPAASAHERMNNERMTKRRLQAPKTSMNETATTKFLMSGSDECPCIDPSHILSTISDCVTDAGSQGVTAVGGCYPLYYGNTCGAHDMKYDRRCSTNNNSGSGDIPSYCYEQWCYVDFKKCKSGDEYFYQSAFDTSKHLFYSSIPSYCYDRWCYVDFNKCKSGDEFFYRSGYTNDKKLNLFYSYGDIE